jgi:hypothetical protein
MDSQGLSDNSSPDSGNLGTGDLHELTGSGPHHQQTLNRKKFWEGLEGPEACRRVVKVLELLDSLDLNVPLFLWAISWSDRDSNHDIVKNNKVRFARTALTTSYLLPEILNNWHKPPRAHGLGIRTQAARNVLDAWAVNTVCDALDKESRGLTGVLSFPQEDISQDTLLEINWTDLASEVKTVAPTTWTIFHHAAWTNKQEQRNKYKNPDAVSPSLLVS